MSTEHAEATEGEQSPNWVVKEITLCLQVNQDYPGYREHVQNLFHLLYLAEQSWEQGINERAIPILLEPSTFTVKTIELDRVPQTGKSIAFATDAENRRADLHKADRLAGYWDHEVVPK